MPHQRRGPGLEMTRGKGDRVFSTMILLAALFTFGVVGEWFSISSGLFSILSAALIGLCSVGIFALSYRTGTGELRGMTKTFFVASLVLYVIAQTSTLFLVGAIIATILAIAAFTIGRREVPWKWIAVLVSIFVALHAGTGEMRDQYWHWGPEPVQVWNLPAFYAKWMDSGVRSLGSSDDFDTTQPLHERVSLVHLLLKVLDESPEMVPYLYGETYAIVPELLIPRIFNPEKITSHEGTTILNVHYGIQSRSDTQATTIGWGLLNEAIANFGLAGVLLFGIVTGTMFGWVSRVTADTPVLSLRMLVAITFMAFAVQTEYSAGVYVSALFQSLVSLFALSFLFMDRAHSESS
jgi:hypothetical protein